VSVVWLLLRGLPLSSLPSARHQRADGKVAEAAQAQATALQAQQAALEVTASAWVGSALVAGGAVAVLLLLAGSVLVEVEPFVPSPVF
jgi:hypothetical protein